MDERASLEKKLFLKWQRWELYFFVEKIICNLWEIVFLLEWDSKYFHLKPKKSWFFRFLLVWSKNIWPTGIWLTPNNKRLVQQTTVWVNYSQALGVTKRIIAWDMILVTLVGPLKSDIDVQQIYISGLPMYWLNGTNLKFLTVGEGSVQLTSLYQLVQISCFFAKQANLTGRWTVLSLPLQ